MDFQRFKESFDKGKTLPVYLIYGEEDFFIHEALGLIKSRVLKDEESGVSLIEMEEEEVSLSKVLEELETLPFFGSKGRRLVVVYNAGGLVSQGAERLRHYLDSPSPYGCLVLVCRKIDIKTPLYNKLNRLGGTISCKPIQEDQLTAWISERVRVYGKQITLEASGVLVENIGNNLSLLDRHLEKLSISVGRRKKIEREDVEELVGADHLRDIWELSGAVARKDLPRALRILDQLLKTGKEPVGLIPPLTWQIRRLWKAKRLLKEGGGREALVYGLKVPCRFVDDLVRQTKLFSEEDLERDYQFLLEADIAGKTSRVDSKLLLEGLIFKLCENKGR